MAQTDQKEIRIPPLTNNQIKEKLIQEVKQLKQRQTMIRYYIHYEFPTKQRYYKGWWEDIIEKIIKQKKQIYVTFKDLDSIMSIRDLKAPFKTFMNEFKKDFIFLKQEDLQQKGPQIKPEPWYIKNIKWFLNRNKNQIDNPFTCSPQEKVISASIIQKKQKQISTYFRQNLKNQNCIVLKDAVDKLAKHLDLDQTSVILLLKSMKKQKIVSIINHEKTATQLLIFNEDKNKLQDPQFHKVIRIKYDLKKAIENFEIVLQKHTSNIQVLKQKARRLVQNGQTKKSKAVLQQIVALDKHRNNIELRIKIHEQNMKEIELNQMDKSTIQVLSGFQQLSKEMSIDQNAFEAVIQREKELRMQSDINNKKFQELESLDGISNLEVDEMMKQIQMGVDKERQAKQQSKRKQVQPKTVNVIIEEKTEEKLEEKQQKGNEKQKGKQKEIESLFN